jgi:hypothetical protein
VRSPAMSVHYLCDIARIAARCRIGTSDVVTAFALPATSGPSTTEPASPASMRAIARLVAAPGSNRQALSYYMFHLALDAAAPMTWTPTLADAPNAHFAKCVRAYAEDCKFKRHGDLYLWSLIRLKIPAWLGASYPGHTAPWAAFSVCFGDIANEVGRDMIGTPAGEQLDAMQIEIERYVIIIAIVFELTAAPGTMLVNTMLLTADPELPSPYASSDFATHEGVFGYVHRNEIKLFEDPWTAALAWLCALKAAVGGLPDVDLLVAFAQAPIPPPDNLLCKFLA